MKIIKNKSIVEDDWSVLRLNAQQLPENTQVPEGKVIVPLQVWLTQRQALLERAEIGVWFASDERPELLKGDIERFSVIAIDFPKFSDGRGYSIAYNLRVRLGYTKELRAIGDVLRDQLFYMQRVGFDAFEPRSDRNIEDALKGLTDFSEVYQKSVDQPLPLFRRVERSKPSNSNPIVNYSFFYYLTLANTLALVSTRCNILLEKSIITNKQKMNLTQTINHKLNGHRILIVEDNELNQIVIKEILERAGANVTIAADGKESLEALGRESFDCVLMDIQMPVMDGLEATEKIRSSPQWVKLPIIALTANADNHHRNLCQQVGMNDFIAKPIGPRSLIDIILKWL